MAAARPTALALVTAPASGMRSGDAPGWQLADPAAPHVSVLDLGVVRGDGIFETVSIGAGRPQALEPHLRRFARSAASLDLPEPDADVWRAAVLGVIAELERQHGGPIDEGAVKTVLTRGLEGVPDAPPTGWVHGSVAPDFTRARTEGIAVVMLDRGLRHDVERTSPWLLAGAKTLSYAVNKAVLREAARRGADDVIFVSSDGYVLEGPSSTVVFRRGDRLLTPGVGLGILEGTTQGSVFEFAAERGLTSGFELLTPEQLAEADDVWLVSSVRHAAPIRQLDGVVRPVDREFTDAMNAYLRDRVE